MDKELSIEELLDKKRDFSQLLVHLTRDDEFQSAKEVLETILDEQTLRAYNHFCLFSPNLKELEDTALQEQFKVVCFTETPIDQIEVVLNLVKERKIEFKPYGLVFKKDYIKQQGGNPVFYITKEIAKPIWDLYWPLNSDKKPSFNRICKLLALFTVCEEGNDWHWEREWRTIGDLKFNLNDVYCGLCPEAGIEYFENKYYQVKFISPFWGISKILEKLVMK